MEASIAEKKTEEHKLPKNSKENRYYYRHREEILEKRRLARLANKEACRQMDNAIVESLRKKKMEFLGLGESKK